MTPPKRRRLSPRDRQSYIFTKLPDPDWDVVAAFAKEYGCTMYEAARSLIYTGLAVWAAGAGHALGMPDALLPPRSWKPGAGAVGAREGGVHVPS